MLLLKFININECQTGQIVEVKINQLSTYNLAQRIITMLPIHKVKKTVRKSQPPFT
jgi:hypothetical protein